LDWKTPSGLPLTEWYRRRAQQLREKYDYLLLTFSGGGDSTNVLDSFILNNIHLDEVMVWWPRHLTAGKYVPNPSEDAKNYSSEWDYLIEPKLKWLEKVAPRTKITIVDNLVDLKPEESKDDLTKITVRHTWNGIKRWQGFDSVLEQRQKTHKNCAIIMGINPPVIAKMKRHFLVYFVDSLANALYGPDYTDQGLCRNVEFFYWTPDMPELVREQAHALLNNLRLNPQFLNLVSEWNIDSSGKRVQVGDLGSDYEKQRRWIKSVLYPSYDYRNLQVNKIKNMIGRSEWFSWFYDNPHSHEIIQPHLSAITSHQNLIDPSFLIHRNGEVNDYYPYRSKLYFIGDLT
jgi:hypothetical protein